MCGLIHFLYSTSQIYSNSIYTATPRNHHTKWNFTINKTKHIVHLNLSITNINIHLRDLLPDTDFNRTHL